MKKMIICLVLLIPVFAYADGNTANESFSKAKKRLLNQVYYDHRETFYCGCPFTMEKKIIPSDKFSPDIKHSKRAAKIEWEHVVPAHAFGQSFKEWRDGDSACVDNKGKAFKGRKCAEKVNMLYRYLDICHKESDTTYSIFAYHLATTYRRFRRKKCLWQISRPIYAIRYV